MKKKLKGKVILPPLGIFWHKIDNEWNANPLIDGPNQRKSYQKQIRHLKKIFTTKQISPRSKQHLSTKRWLHICFDLRARYLFSSKRFHINHIRCWKSTKISKLNSAKSWKRYFRQKKKQTGLQLSTNLRVFRKGRLLKKLVDISRNTNNQVSLHKFDCNIHSSSLDQSKKKVI